MAVHISDVVLLPSSSFQVSKLRSLTLEDNFNNTFALHREVASQRYKSFSDNIYMSRKIFFQKKPYTKLPNLVIFIIFAPEKRIPLLYENNI